MEVGFAESFTLRGTAQWERRNGVNSINALIRFSGERGTSKYKPFEWLVTSVALARRTPLHKAATLAEAVSAANEAFDAFEAETRLLGKGM